MTLGGLKRFARNGGEANNWVVGLVMGGDGKFLKAL